MGARIVALRVVVAAAAAGVGVFVPTTAVAGVEAFRSQRFLPSSNGRASIAYDSVAGKLTHFYEHPYRFPSAGVESRNFAYDAYPGVRVGGAGTAGTWLTTVTPSLVEYVRGTGVVHVKRSAAGLDLDEYHFAPIGLAEQAAFMILKVTRTSGSGAVDSYALYNFHLGSGSPAPGADGEQSSYSASRDAFYEYGPAGLTIAYGSIGASSRHASTPSGPFAALNAGQDLANNAGTSSATSDVAVGFQSSLGDLAVGASAWSGWYVTTGLDSDAQPVVDRVRTFIGARSAETVLNDEIAAWQSWRAPAPAGASTLEAAAFDQAQAVLRMAQVRATGKPDGQILASLAPGQWNIAWVRDMAYATVALARLGHVEEAKRAIRFQLAATAGHYQDYVGKPYAISVVRYFGNGDEESDSNADGPNVEFDGFGLFLWALAETAQAAKDPSFVTEVLPRSETEVGDVLVSLQEATTGLIAKDSSIWEVHWNGKEEHFAYTSITAAKGLCALASLVESSGGDATLAKTYRAAGKRARDAIVSYMRAPSGAIAQSAEALARGKDFLDAAAVEAMNLGLVHPQGKTAKATLDAMRAALVPPSGRGFFRNQKGGWYDSQEWIFVDLRTAHAMDAAGASDAAPLLAWNVAQASENFGLFAELHDRVTADYRGEVPMVGFGAGAYTLTLLDRGKAIDPACGDFPDAPTEPTNDGGVPDGGGTAVPPDASSPNGADPGGNGAAVPGDDSGCGCALPGHAASTRAGGVAVVALAALARIARRRRGRRES